MVQISEGTFNAKDGKELYTKTWKPETSATAIIIFLHGFSDHCSAYYNFFPTLASPPYNIAIHSFDQRGWGRSVATPADKGLTGPTSLVLSDIHDFTLQVQSLSPEQKKPIFLMGHSMGGAEALQYLLSSSTPFSDARPKIAGLILEAPYIALDPSSQPNPLTVIAGKIAAKLLPSHQLLQKLDATYMSHSKQVRDDWVNDALCHDTGTLEGLAGMLQRSADLVALSKSTGKVAGLEKTVPCALWQGHGSEDRVTSFPASRALFEALIVDGGADGRKKVFRTYEGGYHKLHAEPDGVGEKFASDVGDWVLERVKEVPGAGEEVKPKL